MSPPVPSPLSLRAAAPCGDSLWVSLAPRGRRSIFFEYFFFFYLCNDLVRQGGLAARSSDMQIADTIIYNPQLGSVYRCAGLFRWPCPSGAAPRPRVWWLRVVFGHFLKRCWEGITGARAHQQRAGSEGGLGAH